MPYFIKGFLIVLKTAAMSFDKLFVKYSECQCPCIAFMKIKANANFILLSVTYYFTLFLVDKFNIACYKIICFYSSKRKLHTKRAIFSRFSINL